MNKIVALLLTVASTMVYADDVYRVVRNDPAYTVSTEPVQVCQRMGAYGAPMCDTFFNKVKVPANGYHVVVLKDGSKDEKFFVSETPYVVGSLVISNKD